MTSTSDLADHFLRACEEAAIAAARWRGRGERKKADGAAVEAMRAVFDSVPFDGRVAIGEGERDDAPMLYIGEPLGSMQGVEGAARIDIAVDPLEGTNFTAKNLPNALSVIAVTRKDNLLHAPDIYMEKIAIGPNHPKNLIDLDFGIKKNIKLLCESKKTSPNNLTACVLKRPRHDSIVNDLNSMGVKINFISDGDVSGVISVAEPKSNIDIYIGIGGAPEGVLAAAALDCLNCQMQTRLVFEDQKQKERAKKLGIKDLHRKYNIDDMIKGDVIFCATGVTDGDLVNGIKDNVDFFSSETLVLHKSSKTNKKIINKIKK